MIYFIKSESGHVKIGYTEDDVGQRLYSLQCGCPFKLNILKIINGSRKHEKAIHKIFKENKTQNEWFKLSPNLEKFIDNPLLPDISMDKITHKKMDKIELKYLQKIKSFMEIHKLTANQLAKQANVDPASLYRFLNEERSITLETLGKLEEAMQTKEAV